MLQRTYVFNDGTAGSVVEASEFHLLHPSPVSVCQMHSTQIIMCQMERERCRSTARGSKAHCLVLGLPSTQDVASSPAIVNLEPLEELTGLGPGQGLGDAPSWDSDDDERVACMVHELEDLTSDYGESARHRGFAVSRRPNLHRDFDARLACVVKQSFGIELHDRT
jgi:hypothetical protein